MMRSVSLVLVAGLAGVAFAQPCTTGFQPGEPGLTGINDTFSAYISPMAAFNNRLIVGGAFSQVGPFLSNGLGAFNPANDTWSTVGGGIDLGSTNGFVAALTTTTIAGVPSLVVGGSFNGVRNAGVLVPESRALAVWNGTSWSTLGSQFSQANFGSVWSLLPWPQPGGATFLVAGGGWSTIGSATADGIAYYDGTSWQNFAGPSDLGLIGSFSPTVFALALFENQLYIGGRFTGVNGISAPLVARWNGTTWQRVGTNLTAASSTSDVTTLFVWNDGTGAKLYAGGAGMRVSGQPTTVARWDPAGNWSVVGQNLGGRGTSLAAFNDGTGERLYMGMTADAQQRYFYRLESGTWQAADNGVATPITSNFPSVFGLFPWNGSLYVGGNFRSAGGEIANGIARFAPCPGPTCDSLDFNQDGDFPTPLDLEDFIRAVGGSFCSTCSTDLDFNNDGDFPTPVDVEAFISVSAGGPCV